MKIPLPRTKLAVSALVLSLLVLMGIGGVSIYVLSHSKTTETKVAKNSDVEILTPTQLSEKLSKNPQDQNKNETLKLRGIITQYKQGFYLLSDTRDIAKPISIVMYSDDPYLFSKYIINQPVTVTANYVTQAKVGKQIPNNLKGAMRATKVER